MSAQTEKLPKIGTEITVRISLTFQEAPDVHTLLAMTPVRERGKLVRLALGQYIAQTGHPAGDVEQQICAIAKWLRSRASRQESTTDIAEGHCAGSTMNITDANELGGVSEPTLACAGASLLRLTAQNGPAPDETAASSLSIDRWLKD